MLWDDLHLYMSFCEIRADTHIISVSQVRLEATVPALVHVNTNAYLPGLPDYSVAILIHRVTVHSKHRLEDGATCRNMSTDLLRVRL
jgi:hypothetical protein